MANTNFGSLQVQEQVAWSRDLWRQARDTSFATKFMGKGSNAMIQRISTLTKNSMGTQAVITLLADLTGDGIAGDNTLEGREEALNTYEQKIQIDQLRLASRNTGRMDDQKTIINFRRDARDVLGYAFGDRVDQLMMHSLASIPHTMKLNGETRTDNAFANLSFSGDVRAPTANRVFRWDEANGLEAGDVLIAPTNTNLDAADTPSYKMMVELKAKAKVQRVRGIRVGGGEEVYHMFISPQGMARLKLDGDYLSNIRHAGVRGKRNELFAGSNSVLVDGVWVHETPYAFQNEGASTKWGGGNVAGQRIVFAGAQALGMADIGHPSWIEESYDYGNQKGISVGKIFGFKKPQFLSNMTGQVEDFGCILVDTAI